ncbi:MAG TPA: M48 family metallopeptidase [Planctomycetota bacterium]|nr:M48 family metallopeptidase [Planctomycetota bacterium]
MNRVLRPFLFLLVTLLPGACANLNFYSDEDLEPLSLQAYEEATKEHGEVTSGRDYEMVQRVAKKIAAASEENFQWQARLLKADDTPNAFCLPNGRIAIYTGILPITQNEDCLAIVMGHEVAHAVLRHGGKRMTQGTLTAAGLAALEAGLGMTEMSKDAKNGVMAALGMGAQVTVTLPFSRDNETEADVEGLRYAIRAGYDPNEAPKLWERMAKLSGGNSTPVWLSTHPGSEARAQKLREMIPTLVEQEKNWRPKAPPGTTPTKSVQPGAIGR